MEQCANFKLVTLNVAKFINGWISLYVL